MYLWVPPIPNAYPYLKFAKRQTSLSFKNCVQMGFWLWFLTCRIERKQLDRTLPNFKALYNLSVSQLCGASHIWFFCEWFHLSLPAPAQSYLRAETTFYSSVYLFQAHTQFPF